MEPRRTAIQRTHRALLVVLAGLFLVLLGTGIWLSIQYQPTGSFVGSHPQSWVRVTHRVTSKVFLFTALAWFGIALAASIEGALTRGMPSWLVGLLGVLGALVASFTGFLLPWDQLALAPIRPGQYRGYAFLFGHSEVHFVLVGANEVGKATVRNWFFLHTVVVPVVLLAIGVVGWRVTRRRRLRPEPSPPSE